MVEGSLDRRVIKLENEMTDIGKIVVSLETNQSHIMLKQDRMLLKLDEAKVAGKSNPKESVTFKWILEKIALPLIISGASAGAAIYAAVRFLGSG